MSQLLDLFELWPVRVAIVGGAILLVGRLLLVLSREPARRAVVGTAAVAAALMVIPLSLLPGWLPVNVPVADAPADATLPESPQPAAAPLVLLWIPDAAPDDRAPAWGTPEPTREPSPAPAEAAAPPPTTWDLGRLVLAGYGLIAGLLLVRLAMGHIALARLWRAARPAPEWAERLFRECAADTCARASLRVGARTGPVCFGVWRPRVLVPAGLLALGDGPAVRAVFTHELGHLARRDPLAGWMLGLARAVYFVWPWLAGLRREVRLAQEHLADAAAARTASPADYAELLIRMTRTRPAPLGAAGARGPSSELYRRVTMLLRTRGQVTTRCTRRFTLAIAGGLTALAVLAAGLNVRTVSAAEPEKKEADRKDAPKPDPITQTIEKLKKDLGDDPEAKKRLDDLIKSLKEPKAAPPAAPANPPFPPAAGFPQVRPIPINPALPEDELLKELLQGQGDLLKQVEQMLGQVQGRGGIMIGPGGVRRLGPVGGGRLGVRVDKPSDAMAAQLDLPAGQGLVCVDVPADSPAGKAGVKPFDILLEVAGKPVPNNRDEFVKNLKEVKPDAAVDIVVLRKGKKETVKGVTLPEAKEPVFLDLPGGLDNLLPGVIDAPPLPIPPPLPPAPGNFPGGFPRAAGAVVGPGETVRVEQVNDAFTVLYAKNGVKVTVTGTKEAGDAAKIESIEVDDKGKTTKAESIDKLPKEYQDLAKSAIKAIK